MAVGQRIRKAAQRAARQRTKRVQARQRGRTERRATRQAGRTERQASRQAGRTLRSQAKSLGGKWSPGSTAGRWEGAADLVGTVAAPIAGLVGGRGSGSGYSSEEEFYLSGNGNGNGNGGNGAGWWASQSQAMQIGNVAAGAAGLWFLLKKK